MKYCIAVTVTEEKQAETLKPYCSDSAPTAPIRKIIFTDENAKRFLCDYWSSRQEKAVVSDTPLCAVGEDGRVYEFYQDGRKNRTNRRCSLKKYDKAILGAQRKAEEEERLKLRFEPIQETEIVEETETNSKYQAYHFVDGVSKRIVPFRFRKAKEENRPLVVFFHGAGSFGTENKKPMKDFYAHCAKLRKHGGNVLIPQAPYFANASVTSIENHVNAVKRLIDELSKTVPYDKNRVYLIGVSFGGACVWDALYCFPENFACGIPMMGMLPVLMEGRDRFDVRRLEKENIWMAHSASDRNVPIGDDDFIAEHLKKIGVTFRYTRWKRLGHGMSSLFAIVKPWDKWMFEQARKNEKPTEASVGRQGSV